MKCVVLAGGSGDALWPLSRRNYPKQFIHLNSGRSPFQEAVTRNLPFCDEFLILTSVKYENIARSQLAMFQGLKYRFLLEEVGRQTAPIVLLCALLLEPDTEMLVVSCDHVIGSGDYNGVILEGQRLLVQSAEKGEKQIVAIGCPFSKEQTNESHNFFDLYDDGRVDYLPAGRFTKGDCDSGQGGMIPDGGVNRFADSGIFLIRAGDYCEAIRKSKPKLYDACRDVFEKAISQARVAQVNEVLLRGYEKNASSDNSKVDPYADEVSRVVFLASFMEQVSSVSIGDAVYAPWSEQGRVKVAVANFEWHRLLSLEHVADLWKDKNERVIKNGSEHTRVINHTDDKLVVLNDADHLLVVCDKDAVYISSENESGQIKSILAETEDESLLPYFDEGDIFYTTWGCKETLTRNPNYMVKKLTILPGRSISVHKHEKRSEHWSVVSGTATITMDGVEKEYQRNESIFVPIGCYHEIRNDYARELVVIEVSVGESVATPGVDMIHAPSNADVGDHENLLKHEMLNAPIVRLLPAYKDYIWGGNRMRSLFGMGDENMPVLAESWVLSAHRDGKSVVVTDEVQEWEVSEKSGGQSAKTAQLPFDQYVKHLDENALGWKSQPYERFPILVKFIDAKESLSVQVHPADTYALEHENDYGKNEMWYVMDAAEGSFIYLGFEKDTSPGEVKRRIAEGTLTDILHKVPVKKGDSVMVPAGCVHAIGGGILILEVQQSSNATYRLYDYNRIDANGNPRALHLEKALANMDYSACTLSVDPVGALERMRGYRRLVLQHCKYFSVSKLAVDSVAELVMDASSFYSIVVLSGEGIIETEMNGEENTAIIRRENFRSGDSFFLPAGQKIVRIKGECEVILSHI
ncbi:MAG: cupin domain-containing protein [Lachnospiraceae bacterium]|nr:cupin domain-containing protein [Lachnospiraceae bacterium]